MSRASLLLLAQLVAFWPVWAWMVQRVVYRGGEPWGLLALGAAVAIALRASRRGDHQQGSAPSWPQGVAAALTAAYGVALFTLPPLLQAAIAMAALATTVSVAWCGRALSPGLLGLSLLALPDPSTLQFFVGYPFRVAVGGVSAGMLGALGLPVDRQGTLLVHAGRAVHVDAPCSGVWMLWVALVVVCALSFARRLGWTQTVALALVTLPVVFVGNTVRTLALFLVESGRVEAPSWLHESVGLLVFAAMVAALLWLLERIEGRTRWAFASR